MIIKFKIVIILTLLHYKCFSQNNIDNYKDIDKKELKIISENILEKYLYNYLKSLNRKLDNEYSFFSFKKQREKEFKNKYSNYLHYDCDDVELAKHLPVEIDYKLIQYCDNKPF
jgi:hypothetical protein